jgi:hypothetical protein
MCATNSESSSPTHSRFGDFIIYVDESGDHQLTKADPSYPVFVLSFCIFRKDDYIAKVVPGLQRIKLTHFGHDMVVFHEHAIRKAEGPFAFLTNATLRGAFMNDINIWVRDSPFVIIAVVIEKLRFSQQYSPVNPYHFAMKLGLERVGKFLDRHKQSDRRTHVVFESRGKQEDEALELEFRRVCDGANYTGCQLDLEFVLASKAINSCGLQLADLTARPIGLHVMRPGQTNRAYDLIATKLDRSANGQVEGYGLKTYP